MLHGFRLNAEVGLDNATHLRLQSSQKVLSVLSPASGVPREVRMLNTYSRASCYVETQKHSVLRRIGVMVR